MSNTISCPTCQTEIEISEAISTQLNQKLRQEFENEFRQKETSLKQQQANLQREIASVEEAKKQLDEQVRHQVEAVKAELMAKAKIDAAAALESEIKYRDDQLKKLQSDLRIASDAELELRKQKREVEEKAESLELEVTRKLDQERDKIRTAALKQAAEENRLKEAENEKKISEMKSQINDLKRKAEQGSVQIQGEVQELDLEQILGDAFPHDTIDPVAKGVHGADAKQTVRSSNGNICGAILWESKRTKAFQNAWLPKLRDDQRAAKASIAVLVSQTLPDDVDTFALIDGVWVCSRSSAKALAVALRAGLIEAGKRKLAAEGRVEKTELVYTYVSGAEFQHCVEGMVEAVISMQSDLESEKRSSKRQWSKREKQIERAVTNMAMLYGNLQGIVGGSMPAVEGLQTALIDSNVD